MIKLLDVFNLTEKEKSVLFSLNFLIFARMKAVLFLTLVLHFSIAQAQQKYWIYFNGSQTIEGIPQLSERALHNREVNHISLTHTDYPLSEQKIKSLENAGVVIQNKSRWLHAVTAYLTDEQLVAIKNFYFIKKIEPVKIWKRKNSQIDSKTEGYGNSQYQIDLFNLKPLHQQGFTGKNIFIGVFDSGFDNADKIRVFDSLRTQNRIKKVYDFVNQDTTVWNEDAHGTGVLSCIVGYSEDTLIGSGYHAEVALARTETVASETIMEEDNWVAAMEWADSLGVDIISTSLGYNEFDDSGTSHSYSDLDGNTTIIARGADEAAKSGIVVVVSAGNEGSSAWYHITTPCDADSALCVGAVNAGGNLANFSSIGPSSDGQIKPDICAMGQGVTIANAYGGYQFSNGTSFACPLAAGLVACLKQANPTKNNMEIINAVRMSSSNAWSPDSACGYGIPNAMRADSILKGFVSVENHNIKSKIKTHSMYNGFKISGLEGIKSYQVNCWSVQGQKISVWEESEKTFDMSNVAAGIYLLEIKTEQGIWTKKVVWKQQ